MSLRDFNKYIEQAEFHLLHAKRELEKYFELNPPAIDLPEEVTRHLKYNRRKALWTIKTALGHTRHMRMKNVYISLTEKNNKT